VDWAMVGALSELLGAAVVVGSIVYLASEVRHNTAVARSDAGRELANSFSTWLMGVSTDPQLAKLWVQALYQRTPRSEFTPEEAFRVSLSYLSVLRIVESAYRGWKEGILTEEQMRAAAGPRSAIWDVPFVFDSWPIWKRELAEDFQEYMEAALPPLRGGQNQEA